MAKPNVEEIRRRYEAMVALRNNAGAPSQVEADIRDLLRIIDGNEASPPEFVAGILPRTAYRLRLPIGD